MRKRKSKLLLLGIMLLAAFLILSLGCRGPAEEEPVNDVPEEGQEEPAENQGDSPEVDNGETVEAEGRFVGFADARSVEIEMATGDQEFMVFRLDDPLRERLEEQGPEPGAPVAFTYLTTDRGQPVMIELEEL